MGGLLTATRAKISSSNLILRDQHFNRISNVSSKRESFFLEPLENRLLLSVGLVGIPDWVPEGLPRRSVPVTSLALRLPSKRTSVL